MRAIIVALVVLATAAAADPKDDRKAAERYYRAGEKAYRAQNFAAAATNFEEAFKLIQDSDKAPGIAFNAAQAYRRQYRVEPKLEYARRAVELYRVYLDKVKTGGKVGVAADSLGEMQREVDKLVANGAKAARELGGERTRLGVSPVLGTDKKSEGMQEIADLPDDSAVKITTTIDGKDVPPFQMVDVDPGPHKVHVEAEGYLPYDSSERVVKGTSQVAEVVLVPRPAKVTLATERGARIRVDGRAVGTAPLAAPLELAAGKHIITVVRSGRIASSRDVDVARGQELAMRVPLEKTGRRRAVPFVAAGAAVLGAISLSGLVYTIVEDKRADDELAAIRAGDQRPESADRYDRHLQRRDEVLTATIITGGAALAVGGIAAALYFLDGPSDESSTPPPGKVTLAPTIAPGAAGVSVFGRF